MDHGPGIALSRTATYWLSRCFLDSTALLFVTGRKAAPVEERYAA